MHFITAALLAGSDDIPEYFRLAEARWQQLVPSEDDLAVDVEALARKLTLEQHWFEHNCGGKLLGQEIMVVSGIARLYDVHKGFGPRAEMAKAVAQALLSTHCSVETKGFARRVAEEYGLELS